MTRLSAGGACHLPALMDVVSLLATDGATLLVVASVAPVSTALTVSVGAVGVFFSASYGGGIFCVDGCRYTHIFSMSVDAAISSNCSHISFFS